MGLSVRVLEQEALPELFRFRYDVFYQELSALLSPEEIRSGYMSDPLDEVGHNYGLYNSSALVGAIRVVDVGDLPDPDAMTKRYKLTRLLPKFAMSEICHVGRLALAPTVRSGLALVRLIVPAFEDGRRRGLRLAVSDCSPYLLPLEEGLGYRQYAEPFNDPAYGLKLPILLLLEDIEHFKSVRSPFLEAASRLPGDDAAGAWFSQNFPEFAKHAAQAPAEREHFLDVVAESVASEHIQRHSLFAGLNKSEIDALLNSSVRVRAKAGDYLIRRGLKESHLYFILNGVVEVLDESGRQLTSLGKGDFIGEIALLTGANRSADVVATQACECLLINSRTLEAMLKTAPELYGKTMRNIARALAVRLQAATAARSEM